MWIDKGGQINVREGFLEIIKRFRGMEGGDIKKNQYREIVSFLKEDNKILVIRKWIVKWIELVEYIIVRVFSKGREIEFN